VYLINTIQSLWWTKYVIYNILKIKIIMDSKKRPSWLWSYGSWIYNYLCNQCLSLLTLWLRIQPRRGVLDATLCDKVCQWLVTGRWFSPVTQVSSTNKTDCHDITEILLKVVLNTVTITQWQNVLLQIHSCD